MDNLSNASCDPCLTEEYEEKVFRRLSCVSINNNQSVYSTFDKIEINTELKNTFGKDIYGRQICSIVTDFLGYHYCKKVNARFVAFLKKCNDLVNESNQKNLANKNAAVILQTSCDEEEVFTNTILLPQLEQLAKSHYIVFRVISHQRETFREAISKIAKELSGRQITILVVRAHGNEDQIQLGSDSFYTTDDVSENDFVYLSPKASIIFDSCRSGCDLAKKIASVDSLKSVFAFTDDVKMSFLTHCCDDHGYGVVAFDLSPLQNQVARRYTYEKGYINEAIPCSVIRENITKTLLEDNLVADKSGDATAQNNIGFFYAQGQGLSQDFVKAAGFYLKAARQGHANAQTNIGFCYAQGQGVSQSDKEAIKWYLKAAKQGYANAQFNLGVIYSRQCVSQDFVKAASFYLKAADQGHSDAQTNLGFCYSNGQGVLQSDEEAIKWYLKAANQGHAVAQYCLAVCYTNGQGVFQSDIEAAKWYLEAAEQGDRDAQYCLGVCYSNGLGILKSDEEAARWYLKAAIQGHVNAKYNLAMLYTNGHVSLAMLG